MVGGDKLSLDICSDYSETSALYLKSMGVDMGDGEESPAHDWVIVDIQNISYKDPNASDGANGSDNGSDNGDNGDMGSNDCSADNNKVLSEDGDCSCMPGYTIDETDSNGACIKDNTMLYLGIGGAVVLGILLLK